MLNVTEIFAVNTYSYTLSHTAADCMRLLAEQGYSGVELMMYPGHLWPSDVNSGGRRELSRIAEETSLRIVALNMPNIDLNIAGATREMRDYSLALLSQFVELAGDIGAPAIVVGPGKANPLFPAPKELLLGHFFKALDRLSPIAEQGGTRLLIENMPFAFLPDAASLMDALQRYGDDRIGVIYDVANGHFIGEHPGMGLRTVRSRLGLVHFSDTGRKTYQHHPVGAGDVPFADIPPVLKEVGYRELPVLEITSQDPSADIADSARRLSALGYS